MPPSDSEKELLLSASLDGALSPDEQAMLDQWFQEDPSALRQRDELAEVNQQLRAALSPLRHAKLDERFAERVVDAAIQQAQRENLSADHPLVRLADRPDAAARPGVSPVWRWAVAAVALAASLMIAVYVGQPHDDPAGDGSPELAHLDTADEGLTDAGDDRVASGGDAADQRDTSGLDPAVPSREQQADFRAEAPSSLAAGPPNSTPPRGPSSLDTRGGPTAAEQTQAESAAMLAETPPAVPAAEAEAAEPSSPQRVPLVAVLVVSVELTPAGRESLAMLEALRAADIELGPAGSVDEQVVAQLRQSQVIEPTEGASSAKLYYIEAPIKQIDRFLLRLMAEKGSFASFGFSIAESPGLLSSVADWSEVDPKTLRHQDALGLARDLVSADGTPLAIDEGPAFIPMSREMGTAGLLMSPGSEGSNADDVKSQILLLVR